MMPDLPYLFKVKGSKFKVTAWRNMGQIINKSAGNCSISIKFTTDYNRVIPDIPRDTRYKEFERGEAHRTFIFVDLAIIDII